MISIFESGYFRSYAINESQLASTKSETRYFAEGKRISTKTTVFLSHKHSDLDELKDFIGFIKSAYNIEVYIDSMDPDMPATTSGETADRIKKIISQSDRFVLLATEGAIESKWCNWELGYGDAKKFKDKIAIVPIKPKGSFDMYYKGNEYLYIYPYIAYYSGSEKYTSGEYVSKGYYVVSQDSTGHRTISPLSKWLNQ